MKIKNFRRVFIYHSPQYPGYTCWCGLWNMPDNSVMCCFTQATGPFKGRGALRSVKIVEADNMGALVAFFSDQSEQEYFMVVNLQHGKNVSKTAAARRVRLTFGLKVKTIQRLNRLTGQVETLKTLPAGGGRTLEIQLPGGTGDLFKWDNRKAWALRSSGN